MRAWQESIGEKQIIDTRVKLNKDILLETDKTSFTLKRRFHE